MQGFFSDWDKWVRSTLKEGTPLYKDYTKKERDYLEKKVKPGCAVLDIGCGFGKDLALLAPRASMAVGIDINETMARKARKRLSKFKNARVLLRNAQNTRLKADSFDYVFAWPTLSATSETLS